VTAGPPLFHASVCDRAIVSQRSRRIRTSISSSTYAVPQLGAVIVPLNYRLVAEDFVYLANHSGSRVLCVHADYLDTVDGVRERMKTVEHFVALEGSKPGWLEYETLLGESDGKFERPSIDET
jgi:fatty-acyl-CoA synthase